MIKKILALMFFLASFNTCASSLTTLESLPDLEPQNKKGFHGQAGLAVINLPKFIGADNSQSELIPLLNIKYSDSLYFRFNRLGGWFYQSNKGFRVGGIVTSYRGIDLNDVKGSVKPLLGNNRDKSYLAGINGQYRYDRFLLEAGLLTDISNNADGEKIYLNAGYTAIVEPQYTLTLAAKIEWLAKDLVDYYYTPAIQAVEPYQAKSATNISFSAIGSYKLHRDWRVMAALSTTFLADEIVDSPIASDDNNHMALLGVSYAF